MFAMCYREIFDFIHITVIQLSLVTFCLFFQLLTCFLCNVLQQFWMNPLVYFLCGRILGTHCHVFMSFLLQLWLFMMWLVFCPYVWRNGRCVDYINNCTNYYTYCRWKYIQIYLVCKKKQKLTFQYDRAKGVFFSWTISSAVILFLLKNGK